MTTIHGFELIKEEDISEMNTKARHFRHIKSGAELLSLENDDENKVFSANFRTPPKTSNGVAHILEHSVLAGSEKYPVKEPFVELLKGSLQTFVNAFTFPDKTCYPCASQNLQ
ncbi:MAG: peptidase M16, partial [Anaerolineae bacterium]|nr:peptidase M16 [Anaerolineae bacterium]